LLYFPRWTPETGMELWRSAGTPGDAQLVADLNPGSANGNPLKLTAIQGSLFFWAYDSAEGWELWHSAGTAESTARHAVAPGARSAATQHGTPGLAGHQVLFSADDGATGQELWAVDLPAGAGAALDVAPVAATGAERVAGLRVALRAEGDAPATGLTLTLTLADGLQFVGSTLGAAPVIQGRTVSWRLPALGVYGRVAGAIYLQAPATALPGASYPVELRLASASPDPTPANNLASSRVWVAQPRYLPAVSR
ncbi:MAG TPA: hypothetical protein VGE07_04100, partial [Herpetosiphonaceae bacterium]